MPTGKQVLQWLEYYENKIGNSFFSDWDIDYYPCVCLMPDGSLFAYTLGDDYLEVGIGSTHWKQGWEYAVILAKLLGKSKVTTVTVRNPKAYAKLAKATLIDKKTINGKEHYYFERKVL